MIIFLFDKNGGYVVGAARRIRKLDKLIDALFGGKIVHHREYFLVGHGIRKTVGADKQSGVVGLKGNIIIAHNRFFGADRSRYYVLLGVILSLLGAYFSLSEHHLNHRMVVCQLIDTAVAYKIGSAVAYVDDVGKVVDNQRHHCGRSHTLIAWVAFGKLYYLDVGLIDRGTKQLFDSR